MSSILRGVSEGVWAAFAMWIIVQTMGMEVAALAGIVWLAATQGYYAGGED